MNKIEIALPGYRIMSVKRSIASALHPKGQPVVVKILTASSEAELSRALGEIEILKELSKKKGLLPCPKVLKVAAAEEGQARYFYVVMEKAGTSLRQLLKEKKEEFARGDLEKIVEGILLCLEAIHFQKIIHRGLRPSHVLVDEKLNVRLCGFGDAIVYEKEYRDYSKVSRKHLAKMLEKAQSRRQERAQEMAYKVGHPHYRAPEVLLQEPRYNQKVDIWAFGCILGEVAIHLHLFERLPLFPGDCCNPPSGLSMSVSCAGISQPLDQMKVILERLGQPSKEDLSFISDLDVRSYIVWLGKQAGPKLLNLRFLEDFPRLGKKLTLLLKRSLEFNPYFRPSASVLLASDSENH